MEFVIYKEFRTAPILTSSQYMDAVVFSLQVSSGKTLLTFVIHI